MENMFLGFLTFAFMMAFISVEGLRLNRSVIFCENLSYIFSNTVEAACQPEELPCDGGTTCYPAHERCNSNPFCDDGTDETGCDDREFFSSHFKIKL